MLVPSTDQPIVETQAGDGHWRRGRLLAWDLGDEAWFCHVAQEEADDEDSRVEWFSPVGNVRLLSGRRPTPPPTPDVPRLGLSELAEQFTLLVAGGVTGEVARQLTLSASSRIKRALRRDAQFESRRRSEILMAARSVINAAFEAHVLNRLSVPLAEEIGTRSWRMEFEDGEWLYFASQTEGDDADVRVGRKRVTDEAEEWLEHRRSSPQV